MTRHGRRDGPWISQAIGIVAVPFIFGIPPNANPDTLVVDRIHRSKHIDKRVEWRENSWIGWWEQRRCCSIGCTNRGNLSSEKRKIYNGYNVAAILTRARVIQISSSVTRWGYIRNQPTVRRIPELRKRWSLLFNSAVRGAYDLCSLWGIDGGADKITETGCKSRSVNKCTILNLH